LKNFLELFPNEIDVCREALCYVYTRSPGLFERPGFQGLLSKAHTDITGANA
jgi:hypothetical protein